MRLNCNKSVNGRNFKLTVWRRINRELIMSGLQILRISGSGIGNPEQHEGDLKGQQGESPRISRIYSNKGGGLWQRSRYGNIGQG
jgi:hypothetical protein